MTISNDVASLSKFLSRTNLFDVFKELNRSHSIAIQNTKTAIIGLATEPNDPSQRPKADFTIEMN